MNFLIRILFVEDDEIDVIAFKRFMDTFSSSNDNYQYEIATSLKEAAAKSRANYYDIAVSDYSLPDGNGIEVVESLKPLPVIIVTGTADQDIASEAMKNGAYDYLVKSRNGSHLKNIPITIDKTLKRIKDEKELIHYRKHLEEQIKKRTNELTEKIIEKNEIQKKLIRQNRIFEASSKISRILLTVDDFYDSLISSFKIIADVFSVSRVYIFEKKAKDDEENMEFSRNYNWIKRENDKPDMDFLSKVDLKNYPLVYERLRSGNTFSIHYDSETRLKYTFLDVLGIKSILLVPIIMKNFFWGILGIDDCEKIREWSNLDKSTVKSIANNIGHAYSPPK